MYKVKVQGAWQKKWGAWQERVRKNFPLTAVKIVVVVWQIVTQVCMFLLLCVIRLACGSWQLLNMMLVIQL